MQYNGFMIFLIEFITVMCTECIKWVIFYALYRLTFSLEMSRAAVVDVTVDDDLNIFTLALLGGRPHVMSCSLLTHGKRKVVFKYASSLFCLLYTSNAIS